MGEDIYAPRTGTLLSAKHFEIIRSLGKGATGEVFLARALQDGGREVALKVLENPEAFDEQTLRRFRSEVAVLKSLRHPNLIEAYDFFDYNGCLAFTMEHVVGNDLGVVLASRTLSNEEIDAIMLQVLDALHELHMNNILHRDIKLENIMLSESGIIKLADLGLMKRTDSKGLTRPGLIFGTAQYMPPEYIKKGIYDIRGDIYALGVILLELLAGRRRLINVAENKAMEHLIKSRFVIPPEMLQVVPAAYRPIIEKAMAVNPSERYPSAIEMRYDILNKRASTAQPEYDSGEVLVPDQESDERPLLPWHEEPREKSRWASVLGTVVISATIVLAIPLMMRGKKGITIAYGSYQGTVRKSAGEVSDMTIRVSGKNLEIDSEALGCHQAVVDLRSKTVTCRDDNYHVEFEGSRADGFYGYLVRRGSASLYEYRLKKVSTD